MKRCAKKISAVAPKNVSVTVRHQWPPDWSRPESGLLVVIQPWEYGALPKAWVEQAANVDEFWVPSPLVRHMYVDSGIAPEKVRGVPNGVDSTKFRPGVTPLKLATKKKFKFLFVGGTIFRKGPDVLLEAFSQSFSAQDDVCLVIKDFGGDSFYQGQTAENAVLALQKIPIAPEIIYLKEELAAAQLPSLDAACDCLVLPYRGAGFGMPVLEAMSGGLPVIVTGGGATDSFVANEAGWKIPSHGVRIGNQLGEIALVKNGWLLEPSKPQLGALMKYAAAHPDECRQRGANGRGIVERRFDWNDIAAAVAHRLNELAEKHGVGVQALACPANTLKRELQPAVAKIGRLDEARELFAQKNFAAAWNAALAETPADANLVMNLGLELVRSDDLRGGIEKYREAFALMSAQTTEIVPELREALLTQFTSQLYKVRGHEEVVRVLNSPLAKNHGGLNASLHLALGLSLFELKKYSAAVPQMRECIAKRLLPALTPINMDIHTAAPWHCRALCQLRTGDTAGAEKSFEQAVAANGRANEARADFARFLAEQNRAVDALKQLHAAITADATFALAWRLGGQMALAQPELLEFALDWTGEALRNLPEDLSVKSNRAEALLLSGNISEAATLWAGVWEKDRLPRSLAALCVCRLAGGNNLPTLGSPAEEEQCSRAFIGWYQRLLGVPAAETVRLLNENLPGLTAALPTAEKILRAAFSEAQAEPAAAPALARQ